MKTEKELLDGIEVHARHNGVPLNFTRRRYGRQFYTWLEWYEGGQWNSAGDPWPSAKIPKKDLDALFGSPVPA